MKPFELEIIKNPLKTRKDVQNAVKQLCNPLIPLYSKGCAQLHINNTSASYSDKVAMMEAFSRPLWGLVPLLTGDDYPELEKIYLEGIRNGTNPEHEEYWGIVGDYDQRLVEMAVYGLALALIPHKIWEPLSSKERDNLIAWLDQINHHKLYDCNWQLFAVMVNMGFKSVGVPYNHEVINKAFNKIEEYYLSDGWYADGKNAHSDYYVPFAIFYYGLIYAKLMKDVDPVRSELFIERAKRFAKDFIFWFSEDGSAIPYGRSLTYRFSQAAFWSALVFAEVEVYSWGVMKGIILRNLRWWFKQPIFQSDGLLTIGYAYPNLLMSEGYNAPGSPYWALKTFLPLSLGEDHPFWTAEEEPLPSLPAISVQTQPHMILCRDRLQKHVVAFAAGHCHTSVHTHCGAKYEKFAYSNIFGFSVPKTEWGLSQGAFDSTLALSEKDNIYRVKRKTEEFKVDEDCIYTMWKPWNDVTVRTWILPGLPWHIRIHCIDTKRCLDTAEGGFAFHRESNENVEQGKRIIRTDSGIFAGFEGGMVGIINLYGERKQEIIASESNTNLMFSRSAIPTLTGTLEPGIHWYAAAVFADVNVKACEDVRKEQPKVTVEDNILKVFFQGRTFEFQMRKGE